MGFNPFAAGPYCSWLSCSDSPSSCWVPPFVLWPVPRRLRGTGEDWPAPVDLCRNRKSERAHVGFLHSSTQDRYQGHPVGVLETLDTPRRVLSCPGPWRNCDKESSWSSHFPGRQRTPPPSALAVEHRDTENNDWGVRTRQRNVPGSCVTEGRRPLKDQHSIRVSSVFPCSPLSGPRSGTPRVP